MRAIDPLARGRVTLLGDVAPVRSDEEQEAAVETVAARMPGRRRLRRRTATSRCYRLHVRAVRWVGGFGEMDWVDGDGYRAATVDPVLPARHGITAHMNDDHADAGVLLCSQALGDARHVGDDAPRRPLRLRVRRPPRRRRGRSSAWLLRRRRPSSTTSAGWSSSSSAERVHDESPASCRRTRRRSPVRAVTATRRSATVGTHRRQHGR